MVVEDKPHGIFPIEIAIRVRSMLVPVGLFSLIVVGPPELLVVPFKLGAWLAAACSSTPVAVFAFLVPDSQLQPKKVARLEGLQGACGIHYSYHV